MFLSIKTRFLKPMGATRLYFVFTNCQDIVKYFCNLSEPPPPWLRQTCTTTTIHNHENKINPQVKLFEYTISKKENSPLTVKVTTNWLETGTELILLPQEYAVVLIGSNSFNESRTSIWQHGPISETCGKMCLLGYLWPKIAEVGIYQGQSISNIF